MTGRASGISYRIPSVRAIPPFSKGCTKTLDVFPARGHPRLVSPAGNLERLLYGLALDHALPLLYPPPPVGG